MTITEMCNSAADHKNRNKRCLYTNNHCKHIIKHKIIIKHNSNIVICNTDDSEKVENAYRLLTANVCQGLDTEKFVISL